MLQSGGRDQQVGGADQIALPTQTTALNAEQPRSFQINRQKLKTGEEGLEFPLSETALCTIARGSDSLVQLSDRDDTDTDSLRS